MAVVLIDFTPSARIVNYEKFRFDNMFFSQGSYYGINITTLHPEGDEVFGSFRDYYKNQSVNQIDIVGKDNNPVIINPLVSGTNVPQWVTLPNQKSWYENTQNIVHSSLVNTMRQATLTQLGIDVSTYDAVCFVYAGEVGHGALSPATTGIYSTGGERENNKFSHIGTEVHEFAHAYLGARDEYNSIYNPMWWSIMGYGNYNGPNLNSECPASFSPLYRIMFGWVTPIDITANTQNLNIVYNATSPNFYRIKIPGSNDYFVAERRQKDNFDKYTPEYETGNGPNGILIWHAAPDYLGGNSSFERILYAHNDDWTQPYQDHRFPYPQGTSQTISDATSPSIKKRSGSNSYITISNIEWVSGHGEIDVTIYDNYTQNTTISSSITLSRHQKVNSGVNLTVASGATVTILDGITFSMGSGSNVISNGKIIANGTSSNQVQFFPISGSTPGSFGSIIFDGSGAANSILTNLSFYYGTEIRATNAPNITIQNSLISNSINGIKFNGSITSGSILSNTISTPRDHGIVIENSSQAVCNQNVITKTDHSGVAILYTGGASGTIWQNDINGFNWGVGTSWGSSTQFSGISNTNRNNQIINCLWGVYAYQSGYPTVCPTGSAGEYYRCNSIHDNVYYDIKNNTTSSTVWVDETYWGGAEQPIYSLGSKCYIALITWLSDDPWGNPSSPVVFQNKNQNKTQSVMVSEKKKLSLYDGVKLLIQKKYRQAKDFFRTYISEHPDDQEAYVHLYNSYNEETASDIISFFKSLPKEAIKEHKLFLSYLYLKQRDIKLAKDYNEKLESEYPNSELAIRAKLNNFYISLH